MIAIETRYVSPTNTRGSRIIARADTNRVSIPYPHELSGQAVHEKAAYALCAKMNWTGKLAGGGIKNGYVFVFTDTDSTQTWASCCRASHRIADTLYSHIPPARKIALTSTWAEIIASELGIEVSEMV